MTNHARNGAARERRVRDHMVKHGWVFIMRAAGSKGPADIMCAHPFFGGALIQIGTANKSLGPADRERFVTAANMAGCLALLAQATRSGITFWLVTLDKPSKWDRWEL